MPNTVTLDTLSDEQLDSFAKLIYERTGIRVSPQKKTLLSNRLRRRLRATGIAGFSEYHAELLKLETDDPEWDAFLQEITTHETYLFRDQTQWDWFSNTYLPQIQAEAREGKRAKRLRVWSAASSTGDEAYTIACCIADRLKLHEEWKVEIQGSDVGIGALEEAEKAVFKVRAMRNVSDSFKKRFFNQVDRDNWSAKPILRNWTNFKQHNLLDPFRVAPFDIVFVKNVFIYFDADSKSRAFKNIEQVLKPGGMLVTGPAEGISNLLEDYERVQPWLHRKPGGRPVAAGSSGDFKGGK